MRTRIKNYLFPKYKRFIDLVIINKIKRLIYKEIDNKYLFILSAPYCGSTLLNEIISTSPFVSVNNPHGTREGQLLPTVKKIMYSKSTRWDKTVDYDWEFIKKEWRKYWDTTKPVLLEKSPSNILRVYAINKTFSPAYFIILHRNPYAHCQSLISRNKMSPLDAAKFIIMTLKQQRENFNLDIESLIISYDELTSYPEKFIDKLNNFIPEVKGIRTDVKFKAHNFRNSIMHIENLNKEKIKKLTDNQIEEINTVFNQEIELLNFFKYSLIETN